MAIARALDRSSGRIVPDREDPTTDAAGQGSFGTSVNGDAMVDVSGFGNTQPIQSSESPRERQRATPTSLVPQSPQAPGPQSLPPQPQMAQAETPSMDQGPDLMSQLISLMGGGSPSPQGQPAPAPVARAPQILSERNSGLLGRGDGMFDGGIGTPSLAGGRAQNSLATTVKRFGQV